MCYAVISRLTVISECKTDNECKEKEACHRVDGSGVNICIDFNLLQDDVSLEIIQTEIVR